MDWLGRDIGRCLTQAQLASAAAQTGKRQILSETFALCGHNVGHDELKRNYEWMMVRGINLMCQHLEGYSLRGIRKRDYPPAMYCQQPWWADYKVFNDAMSRVGMLLARGEVAVDTLVMHTQTSAWICYDNAKSEGLGSYNLALLNIMDELDRKHIPFHLGDELLMERHGRVEGDTLVIGITVFEPMDYQDASGEWVGFDADLAKAFAESLGVKAEFQIIDWNNKVFELNGKTIDAVWNGMTLTDEVKSAMECSTPYCNNAQIVVVPKESEAQYQTVESLSGLTFAVENGSAGKEQATALLEVSSGTADAAIIDSLMAGAMIGENTSYSDLTCTVSLNSEEYGVGFRKGSDLAGLLNDFLKEQYANRNMQTLAEAYGVQKALIAQ